MVYEAPACAVDGPLRTGAPTVAQPAETLTTADAVAPPAAGGRGAVTDVDPTACPATEKLAIFDPEAMMTEAGTVATFVSMDARATVVVVVTFELAVRLSDETSPLLTCRGEGVSVIEMAGMLIAPLTRASLPLPWVSFVVALPPSSVSWVSVGSRVNAIDVPGIAEGERLKTRWAT